MSFFYCNLNDVKTWLAGLDVSEMPPTLDLMIEQTWIPWAKRQIDMYLGENLDLTTVTEYLDGNGRIELILDHRPIRFLRRCVLRIIPSLQWYEFRRWFHINEIDITGLKIAERGGVEPIDSSVVTPYTFSESSPVPDDLKGVIPTATFSDTTEQYERSDLFINCKLGMLSIPPRILYLENQAIPFWNYTWLRGIGNIEVSYDYGFKDFDSLPQEVRSAAAQFVAASVLANKGQFLGAGTSSLMTDSVSRSFGETMYAGHIKMFIESAKVILAPHKRLRV
jgi:hypothetical protein